MSLLEDTLARIAPPDAGAGDAVAARLEALFPGSGRLGALRGMLLRYAAATGEVHPALPKKCAIICCADHGVAAMGVSAYPPETTVQMTANYLISRGGTANALSNFSGADLRVVDVGIAADTGDIPGLVLRKVAYGTRNMAEGPAMTREEARKSVETGIRLALEAVGQGYRCFLPGEMGIANTTSSAAIAASLAGLSPEEATGRGTNISDERLAAKVGVVRRALERSNPDPADGLDVLAKVGGFELGCIAGMILGAAAERAVTVLDGFNTGAAALVAAALAPDCRSYLMASHLAAERAHGAVLRKLGLAPCMDFRFRLGEATGSSIAASFLDAAIGLYRKLEEAEGQAFSPEEWAEAYMPDSSTPATDRTFEFYLSTMPSLSRLAMEACRRRIDCLAKPVDSLGRLEEIAVQLAGIADEERPAKELARSILAFLPMGEGAGEEQRLEHIGSEALHAMDALSLHAEAEVTLAYLREDRPPAAAFDFGRETAENLAFSVPLLGIAVLTPKGRAPLGHALRAALLAEDGGLRYEPEEFLRHVPQQAKGIVGALLGALVAAAHNSSLVVLGDEAVEIVARYAERLCPAIRPYLLHVQPALLQLGVEAEGGLVACLGLKVVDAALYMLDDMKTFREAGVAVATDGPGARRQARE